MAKQKWTDLPSRHSNLDSQAVDPAKSGICGVVADRRQRILSIYALRGFDMMWIAGVDRRGDSD